MKVKELMALLSKLPDDCEVLVADWNEQYTDPVPLTVVSSNTEQTRVILQDE